MNKNNVNHIDRKELKREARCLLKSNWKVLISVLMLSFSMLLAFIFICNKLPDWIMGVLILAIYIPVTITYYKFFIKGVENNKFSFKDLKPNFRSCFAIFKLVMFLLGIYIFIIILVFGIGYFLIKNNIIQFNRTIMIIMGIGVILFYKLMIIKDILINIYFAFTYMYIIDKNIDGKIGIIKGIQNSYKLIKGYRLKYVEIALSFIGYWIVLAIPHGIFEIFTGNLEVTLPIFIGFILIILWDILGAILLITYFMICKTLLYKELKKRFEEIQSNI